MEKLVCISDFETEALRRLDQNALQYFQSGADEEVTLAENIRAFHRLIIRPRVLRDVSQRSLVTTVLGKPVAFPIGIAPTGMQKLCHEDGELAAARAAATMGSIYVLSTMSTVTIEEVGRAQEESAKRNPHARRWFQLYVRKDRSLAESLVRRAEAAGFEALVLTVDVPVLGKRRENMRNKFRLPAHMRLANFDEDGPVNTATSIKSNEDVFRDVINRVMDQSLTWEDVSWLKSFTTLPIIVKGVLTAEDARLAVAHGVAAVFVSNHGGRQLDTVAPTIDVLEEVVDAVRGRCEVYLDGGVRTGTDVFKAIALGARMVFAGRPFLWGLTVGGEPGVRRVLEIMRDELDLAMSLAGTASVQDIGHEFIGRVSSL